LICIIAHSDLDDLFKNHLNFVGAFTEKQMSRKLVRAFAIGVFAVGAATMAHAQQNAPAAAARARYQDGDIGKHEYFLNCAVCHGDSGKGDGPLVEWLNRRPADLTIIQKNNAGVFPFARVYDVIDGRQAVAAHGPREMPIFGRDYSQEAGEYFGFAAPKGIESFVRGRIIALIGYIYTLQAK
jgi:mono/diheme cytochrome c family protein